MKALKRRRSGQSQKSGMGRRECMDEPVKNSIWNYLIPLYYLEQVSSTFGRRVVELNLTSHNAFKIYKNIPMLIDYQTRFGYTIVKV